MEVSEYIQSESGLFVPFISETAGSYRQVAWAAQPGSQKAFLMCPELEVLLTGPRGSGKTIALLFSFAQQVGLGYGVNHRGVIFRHSQPQQSEVIALGTIIRTIWPECQFNSMKSIYTWPDGESLQLSHYDQPAQFSDFIGKSFSFVGWEELCSWPDDKCYRTMFSCVRSVNPKIKLMVRSTTNPGGSGHDWVKRRFRLSDIPPMIGPLIDDSHEDGALEPPRRCINSKLEENLLLLQTDPNYLERIRTSARSEAERKAWTTGDWSLPSGGFLTDIWDDLRSIIVVPEFTVPLGWKIFRAGDWGYSKPSAIGWFAVSNGEDLTFFDGKRTMSTVPGDLFLVSELYTCINAAHPNVGQRITSTRLGEMIVAHEITKGWRTGSYRRVKPGPLDLSAFDDVNNVCVARDLEKAGAMFEPSTKGAGSRAQGAAQVRARLENTRRPENGPREHPGLFISASCHFWLDLVPTLPVDPSNPDVVDPNACDHCFDYTAYAVRFDTSPGIRSFRIGGI